MKPACWLVCPSSIKFLAVLCPQTAATGRTPSTSACANFIRCSRQFSWWHMRPLLQGVRRKCASGWWKSCKWSCEGSWSIKWITLGFKKWWFACKTRRSSHTILIWSFAWHSILYLDFFFQFLIHELRQSSKCTSFSREHAAPSGQFGLWRWMKFFSCSGFSILFCACGLANADKKCVLKEKKILDLFATNAKVRNILE